ncbi:MAG: hypothetical protein C4K49_12535 [Candidatus Thorarchaeota archaeon]|nr:MAG: hypothetical protein C4K49_12535 [Candidatus Thorarchaeota archaeon]
MQHAAYRGFYILLIVVLLVLPSTGLAPASLPANRSASSVSQALRQESNGEEPISKVTQSKAGVYKTALADFVLTTSDGLSVVLGDNGVIKSVTIDGQTISAGTVEPFAVTDANTVTSASMGGTVQQVGQTVQQTAVRLQYDLNLTYIVEDSYIEIVIEADNQLTSDRAADLSLRMPVSRTGASWWQGPNRKITVSPSGDYKYTHAITSEVPFGHNLMSLLPYSTVCVGDKALCMAVLLDCPSVFFMGYNAPKQHFYCNYSIGFSDAQLPSPGFVRLGLILYKVEARWGIRSAASRYYEFFPSWFSSDRAVGGAEAIDGPQAVVESGMLRYKHADLIGLRYPYGAGNLYGWATPQDGFINSAYGVGSLPYVNPIGLGILCTQTQYNARDYLGILNEYASSAAEINKTAAAFIRNTLIYNRTGHAQVAWSGGGGSYKAEFRCNPILIGHSLAGPVEPVRSGEAALAQGTSDDIVVRDLLDWFSKWIVMPSYEDYDPYGAGPVGIFFDNVGCGSEDLNLTHRAYTGMPLSYVYNGTTRVPVSVVGSSQVELLRAFRAGMMADFYGDMTIYGNLGVAWPQGMYQAIYLDAGLQEQTLYHWGYGGDNFFNWEIGLTSRFAMYQKPISGMDYCAGSPAWTIDSAMRYLHYGMYPLMTANYSRDDALYQKYVPVADRLQNAGWGPMTFASVSNTASHYMTIERFGHWYADSLHFTVRNWNKTAVEDVTISIEADSLAIQTPGMYIRELVQDEPISYAVASNRITFTVDFAVNETKVFRLYKPAYSVVDLVYDVPNPLRPTEVQLIAVVSQNVPTGVSLPDVQFTENGSPLADVPSHRFNSTYLVAGVIVDLGAGSHLVGAQVIDTTHVVEPLSLFSATQAGTADISITLPLDWQYRATIAVDTMGIDRNSGYARVPIDFGQIRNKLGITPHVSLQSLRLVDEKNESVVIQWLPDPADSELGVLVFPLIQTLGSTGPRIFHLYFDDRSGTLKPSSLAGTPFMRISRFGIQMADSTMVLMSPLGANVERIQKTPNWVSFGYTLATQNLTSWEGHLGAYERFGTKVMSYGPHVVTLLFSHGVNGAYSEYGAQVNVYANGVIETWVSVNYSSEVMDTFALSRRYEYWAPRTGYYMGPGGVVVTIPYGQEVNPVTDYTEPWFGQRDSSGRYSFTVVLSSGPAVTWIKTQYSDADLVAFTTRTFAVGETVTYHMVHVSGVGSEDSAIANTRAWLNMTYSIKPEVLQTKPDFMPIIVIVGAGLAVAAVIGGSLINRRRSKLVPTSSETGASDKTAA